VTGEEQPIGEGATNPRLVRLYVRDTESVNGTWLLAGGDAPGAGDTRDGQVPLIAESAAADVDPDHPAPDHERRAHRAVAALAADWRGSRLIGRAVFAGALASAVVVMALNLTSGPAEPETRSGAFISLPAALPVATMAPPSEPASPASQALSASAAPPPPTRPADPAPQPTAATPAPSPAPAKPSGPTLLPITPLTSHIIGSAGLCVDDNSNWSKVGNKIQIWDCNRSDAQIWSFASDGTVRVHDVCMRASGAAPGALVQLWTCDGTPLQAWQFDSDGELVNRAAGLCLTDDTKVAGTQLQVSTCRKADGQRWKLG
jgi:hypothetical protein